MACGGRVYGASLTALLPGTAATFAIAELDGSATKKIQLAKVVVSGLEATAIANNDLRLTMLSSISTGGTATTAVAVPFDSVNPAATAVFRGFTVAPTGGGVVIGAIAVQKLSLLLVTTNLGSAVVFDFQFLPTGSRPTLENATQAIGIDLNGATPANAPNLDIYAWWTEAPLNS
jgi:hypothetical protein